MDQKSSNDELLHQLSEFLLELAIEKRTARERAAKTRTLGNRFWHWLKENGTSVSIFVTIFSAVAAGLWTVNKFTIEQRQEAELRREALIAQFAGELGDKTKRNSAAYALAVLAKQEAIPVLTLHLKEAVKSKEDTSFRNALIQAFIKIGEPSIIPIIEMNRQVSLGWEADPEEAQDQEAIQQATGSVIVYFLKRDTPYFLNRRGILSGIRLAKTDFGSSHLENIDFSKVQIADSSFCGAYLSNANLSGVKLQGSIEFGGANLEGSKVDWTDFSRSYSSRNVTLSSAKMSRISGTNADFREVDLEDASLRESQLRVCNFEGARLESADFSAAQLSGSSFIRAGLLHAKFVNANLTDAKFQGADLHDAWFVGADLKGVHFFDSAPEMRPGPYSGAIVDGTDFEGAKNIDELQRTYLCKWGAKNVPGGCVGIPTENIPPYIVSTSMGGGSCW